MALRKYRNSAARTLAAPIANPTTTSMTVDSASGFPTQYPYTLIIDPDGTLEEVVDVTAAVGNILTVVRGVDSTTPAAHAAGVKVVHGVSARDFTEANVHVNQTAGAHGTTGSLVDTDSAQTIVGSKTFTGGLNTAPGVPVVATQGDQTISGSKTFTSKPQVSGMALVSTTEVQTITGAKTFSGAETHTGAETHSGPETHSGQVQFTSMRPVSNVSTNDEDIASTSYQSGSTLVGTAFTVPDSGQVWVTFSGYISQTIGGSRAILSFRIGTGATVGGGSDILLPSSDRSLVCGTAVNASQPAELQATRRVKVSGLTPGQVQNVVLQGAVNPSGHCLIFLREVHVEPIF